MRFSELVSKTPELDMDIGLSYLATFECRAWSCSSANRCRLRSVCRRVGYQTERPKPMVAASHAAVFAGVAGQYQERIDATTSSNPAGYSRILLRIRKPCEKSESR